MPICGKEKQGCGDCIYTSIKFKIQLSGNYQIEISTTYQILKTYQKHKAKPYLEYAW